MSHKNIGIIGCGNMGSAILASFIESGKVHPSNIWVYDVSIEKIEKIRERYGVNIAANVGEMAAVCYKIILAIKPDVAEEVLTEISNNISNNKVVISIMAGKSIDYIKKFIKKEVKIVRLMPNMPAIIGKGLIAMSINDTIDENELLCIKDLLSSLGLVLEVDEKHMDAITGISGSSPAYVFMFIEALADAGVYVGLSRDISYKIAAQAIMGSAALVLETGKHPGVLKDMVCSPGGTTIEAVRTLEKNGFRSAIMEAVISCVEKSKKL